MLDRGAMLKWQTDREDADRKWQERQRKSDKCWRIIEGIILVILAGGFTILGVFISK